MRDIGDGYFYCSNCGAKFTDFYSDCPKCKVRLTPDESARAEMDLRALRQKNEINRKIKEAHRRAKWTFIGKSKTVAIILWFLSYFGFMQLWAFYLGFKKSAIVRLLIFLVSSTLILVNSFGKFHLGSGLPEIMVRTLLLLPISVVFILNFVDFIYICGATFKKQN